ncbi:bifunctional folylpolyglutamate synthase/dihydrofolate synthase [Synechococcus bigranulatus str. 'Rupite']|uniref:tetrahydrofolate synthase n=1 Tax=Thermostichus vulcanus str. 'Rupite' TaxID=2813851 RepID=A0ABT0CEJ2_THEVL|nr:bifunctional folylpolyglutamate synthase/dihydrofolate synthase [Thermostichus vulcanus str. 'Rupite']
MESLGHFGVDLSLERMQVLLQRLGQPQAGIPVIHVAGTNGKGSVCAWVSHVLWAAGYRVGRYTSPHLVHWRERIWLRGEYISTEDWSQSLAQVRDTLQSYPPDEPSPTQFEVVTAAAWLYFRQQAVEVVVLEVGLGGRLDATNAGIDPIVTAITSIGWDHWQRLGNSLPQIASEKAGILKPGIPLVCAPQTPEVMAVIQAKAEALGIPVQVVQPLEWVGPQTVRWQGLSLCLPLTGDVQLINGAVALGIVERLRQQGWSIPDAAVKKGFDLTRWPGRLQRVQIGSQVLLMDGAHNLPAAQALRRYLDETQPGPLTWYIGILSTKDVSGILSTLLRPGDRLFTLPIAGHSGMDPEQLAQLARERQPYLTHVQALPDLSAFLTQLSCPEASTAPPPVLCGSLYLLGQVMQECLRWDLAR